MMARDCWTTVQLYFINVIEHLEYSKSQLQHSICVVLLNCGNNPENRCCSSQFKDEQTDGLHRISMNWQSQDTNSSFQV